jgi:hypothetical protein
MKDSRMFGDDEKDEVSTDERTHEKRKDDVSSQQGGTGMRIREVFKTFSSNLP